jgi:putative flippase GtrA
VLFQFIKFGFVGIAATLTHAAVATLLIYFFQPSNLLSNVIAFLTATLISYFGNLYFVFNRKMNGKNISRFIIVSSLSLSIVSTVSFVSDVYEFNKYYNVLVIAILLPVVNFTIHKFWTFHERHAT